MARFFARDFTLSYVEVKPKTPFIPAGAMLRICGRIGYYFGEETVVVDYDPETKLVSNPRFPLDVKKSGRVQQRK